MRAGSSRMASDININLYNSLFEDATKRQRTSAPTSELGQYMATNFLITLSPEEFANFDILAWWKEREIQFPILSAMARDLLAVQASTVASESAFSTPRIRGSPILEDVEETIAREEVDLGISPPNTELDEGLFPRLFALDTVKDISVACKLQSPLVSSFRRNVRGGIEEQQLEHLLALLDFVILFNSNDRWVSDLNGDRVFRVKDVRNLLDEFFLPRADVPTRWVKNIPIKVNIFAWKLALDRLPTRANLVQRNVVTESQSCPLCDAILEDTSHLFFNCSLARDVTRLLCRWWNLGVQSFSSYAEWLVWFNSVRLASNLKVILEGVFYVTWWSLWNFRNQLLFASKKPRKESIFDDIVLRSFCWCKARGSSKLRWDSWIQHPYLISL
ncbi:RNA-directed DNA polymerase, eukaryota [Tanacetum coccineum]